MDSILSGLVMVNNTDIWISYGAFLMEDRKGGLDNISAILTPSRTKEHTAVNIREENGEKHSSSLVVANEPRDVVLHFAIYATTKAQWMQRYTAFVRFLKTGADGWLSFNFPSLGLTMRMYYVEIQDKFKPLTYLWKEGVHAGHFRIKFREPDPII
ncbi:MAG: hypothetical protein IJV09_00090 [Prevotella sp.]|nr:hypothetical protein [Prevotella sp.]